MKRLLPGLVLIALALPAPGVAQTQLEKTPAPIAVAVTPSPAAAGSSVSIHGSSIVLDGFTTIQIAVHPPQGEPAALKAELNASGEFTTSYTVASAGSYKVVATSPDGKATAEANVSVIAAVGVTEQSTQALQQQIAEARDGVTRLAEMISQQQASPPQAELTEMLEDLAAGLEQTAAIKLRQDLVPLDKLIQQHPAALAELQPAYDALAEAATTAEEMTAELRDRLQNVQINRLCEDIHAAIEALGLVALGFSATLSPVTTLMNVFVDKTLPERVLGSVPELASNPFHKQVVVEVIKLANGAAQGYKAFAEAQVGRSRDIAQIGTEGMFAEYCEKYEGPMSALFHLEYFELGERWYAYDVKLDGRLVLRYQKGGTGSDIPVRGEFEGAATKFTVWENLIILEPKFRPYLVKRRTFAPTAAPLPAELGVFAKTAASKLGAPGVYYFNVPVEGVIRDDKLALKFDDARVDYDAKAEVIYIFMEPLLPIPELYIGRFPYFGAHYILTRATRSEPVFTMDEVGNTSRFSRTFEREEHKAGSYLVRWKLDVKACNPLC